MGTWIWYFKLKSKMLTNIPDRTKSLFLLKFTEELIRNYKPIYFYRLKEKIIEEERKKNPRFLTPVKIIKPITREEIKEKVKERTFEKNKKNILQELKSPLSKKKSLINEIIIKYPKEPFSNSFQKQEIKKPKNQRILRIPEPRLPERLQYLKPSPVYEEINLGKLNPLIKDFNVDVIECFGTNQKIIVEGKMGKKPTGITLTQEELKEIISEFSKKSKIPFGEGISKVAVGKLTFTLIKNESEIHFTIKKMKMTPFAGAPRPIY